MEEARQHSALGALYLFSLGCTAAALVVVLVGLVAKLPAAGTAFVALMFAGLLSRTAFQWSALLLFKSAPKRRAMALNALAVTLVTGAFFVFVVLHQLGIG
ncbi:hypothetical protein G7078_03325 [Sphingomonas sinipercae]|uniref:Uncharacterized protein n=1 Tax=Sphingomonas sinipercae TaxID=2714944 RepID=A0A6G7ZLQ8_9SPHN|nr:hypothetical protein [Sphingomonas sinipercae]QIL01914.1 hypothetical protein G7078_03325 [Sphingomonas sinipercae]